MRNPPSHADNHFNLMRLGLAVLVILSHSYELVDGNRSREPFSRLFGTFSLGETAVNGFFLLSGFLIVQSWERAPALIAFLQKRVLRIYPGFVVASIVSVFVVGALGAADITAYFRALDPAGFLGRLLILRNPETPPVFAGQPYPYVNGVLWTISYEFRCYLVVALFGLAGGFRDRRVWAGFTLFAVAASVFPGSNTLIAFPGARALLGSPDLFFRFLAFFTAGGCFHLYRDTIRFKPAWLVAAGLAVFAGYFHPLTAQLLSATCGAYLFFGAAFARLPALGRLRPRDDISYGVYLYGWPAQKLLLAGFPSMLPLLVFVGAAVAAAGAGLLSWRLVEQPFLRLKPSRRRDAATSPAP